MIKIRDNRLIICIDTRHASYLCKEFAEKHNAIFLKYNLTVEFNDVTYHFISIEQLRRGKADGFRFTEVKISKEAREIDEVDFLLIDQLRANANAWRAYINIKN